MTGFTYIDGEMMVDGAALAAIAAEHGTPTYVYSAGHIKTQYDALAGAMERALPAGKKAVLCFACKANSNIGVLSYIRSLGGSLEIVSGGELLRGLEAGFDPAQIVFTGVGKTDEEISLGLTHGIKQFNVESLPELDAIQRVALSMNKKASVVFRLNPDVSGGGHQKISTGGKCHKFGIDYDTTLHAFAHAQTMSHVEAVGLSMHIGSQVFEVDKFREAFAKLPGIVTELRAKGYQIDRLDIGGGFPIIYRDEKLLDLDSYAKWVADFIAPLDTEIILEPGRYLVGNAGVLLSKVLYVKEARERNFLIIDAAMNDLLRPALYDAYHGIAAVKPSNSEKTYDVVGPICETGDTFTAARTLPDMQQGDLVVLQSAGAYGMSMASNYNTRGLCAEVLVNEGQAHLVRRRQSVPEILLHEQVPDFLRSPAEAPAKKQA